MSVGDMGITGKRISHYILFPCHMLRLKCAILCYDYCGEVKRYRVVEWLRDRVEGGVVEPP